MRYLIILVLILGGSQIMYGQIKLGVTMGLGPSHIDPGELVVDNINDSIRYSITNVRPVWNLGTFVHLQVKGLYFKGSFLGGFSYLDYDKTDWRTGENNLRNKREMKYQIEVPLEVGINYKRMLLSGGIMYSNLLRPEKETILSLATLNRVFDNDNIGYRFSIGMNFDWASSLEFSYVYFDNYTDTIAIDGTVDYNFSYNRRHIMVSFTWNFIREGWE